MSKWWAFFSLTHIPKVLKQKKKKVVHCFKQDIFILLEWESKTEKHELKKGMVGFYTRKY